MVVKTGQLKNRSEITGKFKNVVVKVEKNSCADPLRNEEVLQRELRRRRIFYRQ